MNASMLKAFGKAAQNGKLDHVQWTESDILFTANLDTATIDVIDLTQATLTYDLYRETELLGHFEVPATAELNVWADKLSAFNLKLLSKLDKGLKDGAIRLANESYYYEKQDNHHHILGMVGEEEVIEKYLKGRINDN